MSGLNKVQLIGRLGRDPEMKYMDSGKAIANFTLATDESYKNNDGDKVERTEWHKLVMFGKVAEIAGEYLKKGSLVYIEGKLQTRSYDKDGETKYVTEIVGQNLVMLGSKSDSSGDGDDRPKSSKKTTKRAPQREPGEDIDEDLGF